MTTTFDGWGASLDAEEAWLRASLSQADKDVHRLKKQCAESLPSVARRMGVTHAEAYEIKHSWNEECRSTSRRARRYRRSLENLWRERRELSTARKAASDPQDAT